MGSFSLAKLEITFKVNVVLVDFTADGQCIAKVPEKCFEKNKILV